MSAVTAWTERLAEWAIPDHIVAEAPASPWSHDTARFSVDDTLDRDVVSARVARERLPTGGTVLDVGCGGGRAAISLVPPAAHVIGVDEDPAMLQAFDRSAAALGLTAQTFQGRWPTCASIVPAADVVTCHHVMYNVADIVPFVESLTAHARSAVVVVLPVVHPQAAWNPAWKHFWDLDRPDGPTSDDLVDVLGEMGITPERWEMPRPPLSRHAADPSSLVPAALRRLCLGDDRSADVESYLASHEPEWSAMHTVLRWPGGASGVSPNHR